MSINIPQSNKKSFFCVFFGQKITFFRLSFVLGCLGVPRGLPGGCLGVPRALTLETPSILPLYSLGAPFIQRMNPYRIKKQRKSKNVELKVEIIFQNELPEKIL